MSDIDQALVGDAGAYNWATVGYKHRKASIKTRGRGGGGRGGGDRDGIRRGNGAVAVTDATTSGISSPGFWTALTSREPDKLTAYLASLAPAPAFVGLAFTHNTTFARDFGTVDVLSSPRLAAAEARSQLLTVVSRAPVGDIRISDVVLRPVCAPFRIVASPVNTLLAPNGGKAHISVEFDYAAASRLNPLPVLTRVWCLVEIEVATCAEYGPLQWTISRSCIGAELRAEPRRQRSAAAAITLRAAAPRFFPSEFRHCFDNAASAPRLPPVTDEDAADALIPQGLRRVIPSIGRAVLVCPPREHRMRGVKLDDVEVERIVAAGGSAEEIKAFNEYRQRLCLALCLEAEQMFRDIKMYDICSARLRPVSKDRLLYVRLRVEGISESRPALVLFDPVRLRPTHAQLYHDVELVARVVQVDNANSSVTLKLPETCLYNDLLAGLLASAVGDASPFRVHVRFCVGNHFKSNCKLLEAVKRLDFDLYRRLKKPSPICKGRDLATREKRARSVLSEIGGAQSVLSDLNSRQWEAIYASVCPPPSDEDDESKSGMWPVLVFGPPGTGKTRTIVGSIAVSLLKHGKSARILATAPSHQAADVLCERLAEALQKIPSLSSGTEGIERATLFRLNPFERPPSYARAATLPHTFQSGLEGYFDLPPLSTLLSFNVIVCTCSSASLLCELPSDHFWCGVFSDESAQSFEPEALVPLAMFGGHAHIVLGGDPQQLNAEVRSMDASALGLHMSLMENMMRARAKSSDGYCLHNVQLRVNYRVRHRALLELSSALFYNNTLIARPHLPERTVIDSMRDIFPTGTPLKFIGVDSSEEKLSERSPGLINEGEAACIADLVYRMTGSGGRTAAACFAKDIAVISNYRCQVQVIRLLLREKGLNTVNVGSVYDQQGMERQVVLVSLTLSSEASLRAEEMSHKGFAGSPKKFNVAITRACELLVVVGNPSILIKDTCWGAFIRQMLRTDCYSGVAFTGMDAAKIAASEEDVSELAAVTSAEGALAMTDYTSLVSELEQDTECDEDEFDYEAREYAFADGEDIAWRVIF